MRILVFLSASSRIIAEYIKSVIIDKVIGINDGEIEDLITELVNRLKPAHSNALVKFTKSKC